MAFRFPKVPPKSLLELFQWIRDLLPQLEPKFIYDIQVQATVDQANPVITTVCHGLKNPPSFVRVSLPDCEAFVCFAKEADSRNIYLRASNLCVVSVEIVP